MQFHFHLVNFDLVAQALGLSFLDLYLNIKNNSKFTSGVNFIVAGATALKPAFFKARNLGSHFTTRFSLDTQISGTGFRVFWVPKNLKAFLDPALDLGYCWHTILMGLGSFIDSNLSVYIVEVGFIKLLTKSLS